MLCFITLSLKPAFQKTTHVHITTNLNPELKLEVQKALYQELKTTSWIRLSLKELTETLHAIPQIKYAEVSRAWPDELFLTIHARSPVACWQGSDYLDETAIIFPAPKNTCSDKLSHLLSDQHNPQEMLKQYKAYQYAVAGHGHIKTLTLEQQQWSITLKEGPLIMLGSHDQLKRLKRLKKVLKTLKEQKVTLNEVISLDLRYPFGFSVQAKPHLQTKKSAAPQKKHRNMYLKSKLAKKH